jgi:hypothetical protein
MHAKQSKLLKLGLLDKWLHLVLGDVRLVLDVTILLDADWLADVKDELGE